MRFFTLQRKTIPIAAGFPLKTAKNRICHRVAQVSKPAVSPLSKSAVELLPDCRRAWKPAAHQTWQSALQTRPRGGPFHPLKMSRNQVVDDQRWRFVILGVSANFSTDRRGAQRTARPLPGVRWTTNSSRLQPSAGSQSPLAHHRDNMAVEKTSKKCLHVFGGLIFSRSMDPKIFDCKPEKRYIGFVFGRLAFSSFCEGRPAAS